MDKNNYKEYIGKLPDYPLCVCSTEYSNKEVCPKHRESKGSPDMTKCTESGCRSLEWKCADCGRVASTARIKRFEEAGLMGCFDGTGVTSENYKDILNGEHPLDKAIAAMDELIKTLESLHKELSKLQSTIKD